MYRFTLWFGADDDERAMEVAEEVATLCDRVVGRPASEDSPITYALTVQEVPDDDGPERWIKQHVLGEGVRAVIVPAPIARRAD